MSELSVQPPTPAAPTPNPWPIRAISLLLVLQAGGLVFVLNWLLNSVDWEAEAVEIMPSFYAIEVALLAIIFTPITLLLVLVALFFSLRRQWAWLTAVSVQGIILFTCLWIHFQTDFFLRSANWLYAGMLYSVIMVLYLNTTDVRLAFRTFAPPNKRWSNPDFRRAERPPRPALLERNDERPAD